MPVAFAMDNRRGEPELAMMMNRILRHVGPLVGTWEKAIQYFLAPAIIRHRYPQRWKVERVET